MKLIAPCSPLAGIFKKGKARSRALRLVECEFLLPFAPSSGECVFATIKVA